MYKFTVGSVLLLNNQNTDLNLRTPVGANGAVDGTGGSGVAAKWVVYSSADVKAAPAHSTSSSSAEEKKVPDEKAESKTTTTTTTTTTAYKLVQLQRYQDPTYFLRVYNDWVDANGLANESPNYLRISDSSSSIVLMTSNDNPDQRIGILPNGQVKTPSTVGTGIAAQFYVIDVTFAETERARETVRVTAYNNVHPDSLGKIMRMDTDGTVDDKGGRNPQASFILKIVGSEGPKAHKQQDVQGPIVTVRLQWSQDPLRHVCLHDNLQIDGNAAANDERTHLILHKQPGLDGVFALESKLYRGKYLDFTRTWNPDSGKVPLMRLTLTAH